MTFYMYFSKWDYLLDNTYAGLLTCYLYRLLLHVPLSVKMKCNAESLLQNLMIKFQVLFTIIYRQSIVFFV